MNISRPLRRHSMALLLTLAGCATTTPPPAPTATAASSTATIPSATAAPSVATPAPPPLMTPDQRTQAKQIALKALTDSLATAHGDRASLRKLLGIPANPPSRTDRQLADLMLDTFSQPTFPSRFVDRLPDTSLMAIQSHPEFVTQVLVSSSQNTGSSDFSQNLTVDQQVRFMIVVGQIYAEATTEECPTLTHGGNAGPAEYKAMTAVLDRLPPSASNEFASLVMAAFMQPVQPAQPPLTQMQQELVKLNMQHYMAGQTEAVRDRFINFYRNGSKPDSDRCWIIGKAAEAGLSGDADIASLGVRLFIEAGRKQQQQKSP